MAPSGRGLRIGITFVALAGLLATIRLTQRDSGSPTRASQNLTAAGRPGTDPPSFGAVGDPVEFGGVAAGPLPQSLEDTAIDGWLGVDDGGQLVITPGARWFFEYFLSATGEESSAQVRARIIAALRERLPPAAMSDAIALLDRYLAYRERTRELVESGSAAEPLPTRLDQLHALRVELFGENDAAALFGEEETVQRLDLERKEVMADASLTPDERARQLADLDQRLPESVRASRAQSLEVLQATQEEAALREAGGSADEIHALRAQRFGAEAADRLAALDAERAEWDQRVAAYRAARAGIEADARLSPDQRAHAIDRLVADSFSPQERLRVTP